MRAYEAIKDIPDILLFAAVYFAFFFGKWKKEGTCKFALNTIMYAYLCLVVCVTLVPVITRLPFIFSHPYAPMNLEPFSDIFASHGDAERQVALNVVMTVPFGFLLPLVRKKQRIWTVAAWTFVMSLSIELIQPLISMSRMSDVTDIITNTVGGIAGYLLFLTLKKPVMRLIGSLFPERAQ